VKIYLIKKEGVIYMSLSLDYIQKNVNYDLTVGSINFCGNIDYVSSHFDDGEVNDKISLVISDKQPPELIDFIKAYKLAKSKDSTVTIESFYAMQEGDR
jgi:hypothetical protein